MIKSSQSVTFKNVLPEHIRDTYPKFVEFLQVYYDYMCKENSPSWLIENLADNMGIDTATDTFLMLLKNEIGALTPTLHAIDRRLFLKHIHDIYESKGSEQSIKSLFQMIYNIPAEVIYPSEDMLRSSVGKWSKQISIRCQLISGDVSVSDLTGRYVTGVSSGAYAIVDRIEFFTYLNYSVYEIFFDVSDLSGEFAAYEDVTVDSLARFNVYPVLSEIKIINGGTGYASGTRLNITNPSYAGIAGRCYIDVVGLSGDIKSIAITDFGVNITPDTVTTLTITDITVTDIIIPLYSYIVDLSILGGGNATAKVVVNGMCRYRGSYFDTSGMPSGSDKIQDSYYYQTFSYVIKSALPLDTYKKDMQLTHSAGYKMFGEYIQSDDIANGTDSILSPTLSSRLTVA